MDEEHTVEQSISIQGERLIIVRIAFPGQLVDLAEGVHIDQLMRDDDLLVRRALCVKQSAEEELGHEGDVVL